MVRCDVITVAFLGLSCIKYGIVALVLASLVYFANVYALFIVIYNDEKAKNMVQTMVNGAENNLYQPKNPNVEQNPLQKIKIEEPEVPLKNSEEVRKLKANDPISQEFEPYAQNFKKKVSIKRKSK